MHSIYCSDKEITKSYFDPFTMSIKQITYEPKDWQIGVWIDNGSQEGMSQRCHEEVLMLRGEVIGKENEYGIDWQYYFDNSIYFHTTFDDETKQAFAKAVKDRFKQDIQTALSGIGNVIKVVDVVIDETKTEENRIVATAFIVYTSTTGDAEATSFTIDKTR